MRLAIIGAGSVGTTLGKAWQQRGHDVTYGVRNPDDPKYGTPGPHAATNHRAARDAEVVVLCTPWQSTRDALAVCGDLGGKVLIDRSNPLTPDCTALEVGHTTSGAEQVAAWAPGARVCKAMNQIGAPMIDTPQVWAPRCCSSAATTRPPRPQPHRSSASRASRPPMPATRRWRDYWNRSR